MPTTIQRPQEILPNPDPSVITTEMIDRAIDSLEKRITAKLDGIDGKYDARLNGIDKATNSFHDDLVRVPTLLDRSILGLRELIETRLSCAEHDVEAITNQVAHRSEQIKEQIDHLHALMISKIDELASVTAERFVGVASQFTERDTRTDQRAGDTKLAVDAAFAAAKEATGKIEAGFTKQIDSMSAMIDTKTKNADDKIAELRKSADDKFSDLKDRMTALESKGAVLDPSVSAAMSSMMGDIRMLRESREAIGGHAAANKDYTAMLISIGAAVVSVLAIVMYKLH